MDVKSFELNDEQCVAILEEGLKRNLYENPGVPRDEMTRLQHATELTEVALAARNNGNTSDNVNAILFIAEVDKKPIKQSTSIYKGMDLSTLAPEILQGLIDASTIEDDIEAYKIELERRDEKDLEEVSQAEAPGEAGQSPSEIAGEGSASAASVAGIEDGSERSGEAGTGAQGLSDGRDASAGDRAEGTGAESQGEDAGAFAPSQVTDATKKASSKSTSATQDGTDDEREQWESKLTLAAVEAHGVDLTKLSFLSTDKIRYIVENPSGPLNKDEEVIRDDEVSGITNPDAKKAVIGVMSPSDVEIKSISKDDLGIRIIDDTVAVSSKREDLEGQITGPMLKAYGRGRREIPDMGEHELEFMITYPTGKVSPQQLLEAKEKDSNPIKILSNDEPSQTVIKDAAESNQILTRIQRKEQIIKYGIDNNEGIEIKTNPSDKQIVEMNQNEYEEYRRQKGSIDQKELDYQKQNESNKEIMKTYELGAGQYNIDDGNEVSQIIAKENFPIPPEIGGDIPILPFDVSKCSRDELFSLHARFHACESRINWILTDYEDEISDIEKLRRAREAKIADEVPLLAEDGKRMTNEQRDTIVAADLEVLNLISKENDKNKVIRKLKVLQKNYYKDCERLSRQMSKYERERNDSPR